MTDSGVNRLRHGAGRPGPGRIRHYRGRLLGLTPGTPTGYRQPVHRSRAAASR
jgi:hypothetical protein